MRIRKNRSALVVTAALALTLAACGNGADEGTNGDDATTGGDGATSDATPDEQGGDASELEGATIGFIPGVTGDSFYISMQCGIQEAAAEHGMEVQMQAPDQFAAAQQTPLVNAMVASEPDALLIAPTDSQALFPPLNAAVEAGIPVGLVDTTLDDPSIAFTSVATDNEDGGARAADALAELINEEGKVMVIAFQAGASTSDARQKGFEDQIATYDNIEYIGAQINNNDPAEAASIVQAALSANPDLNGIFATNLFASQGAATGVRNAGADGETMIVGFDAGGAQIEQLERGEVQALVAQQPAEIGARAVEQVVAHLTGGEVTAEIGTETVIITEDNLEDPEIQEAIYKESC